MKSSKLTEEKRFERKERIFWKREGMKGAHRKRGVTFLASKTTRKVFLKKRLGGEKIEHDHAPYPHSSTRQRARYARQIAAGQLRA